MIVMARCRLGAMSGHRFPSVRLHDGPALATFVRILAASGAIISCATCPQWGHVIAATTVTRAAPFDARHHHNAGSRTPSATEAKVCAKSAAIRERLTESPWRSRVGGAYTQSEEDDAKAENAFHRFLQIRSSATQVDPIGSHARSCSSYRSKGLCIIFLSAGSPKRAASMPRPSATTNG